jgi:uncharacterized glyoxalase superfamily protein PhnB
MEVDMSKVDLNVYMFFGRNCRDAMEFYKEIFGGEFKTFKPVVKLTPAHPLT